MATAEEILRGMGEGEERKYIVIDSDLRTMEIPGEIKLLGVENDDEVQRLWFRMPARYGEVNLAEFGIRINYLNGGGNGDVYVVKDAQEEDGWITFSWLVGGFATKNKGNVQFIVCAKLYDGENVVKEFNTKRAALPVAEGLETDGAVVESNPEIVEDILKRLSELEENGGGTGGTKIDDSAPAADKTYSSQKINTELNALNEKNAAQDEAISSKLEATALPTAINTALAQAKNSGQFDGDPGATGPQGPAGADGKTPVKGTDYWTEQDKAEIVSDVLAALPNASGVSF